MVEKYKNMKTKLLLISLVSIILSVQLAADTVYNFNLDVNPGWQLEDQWEFGVPQGNSGDPTSGYTGNNVYGYNLNGNYGNDLPVRYLTTLALDFTDYHNLSLNFKRWLGIESSSFDQAHIQASSNGMQWITVWKHNEVGFTDKSWQDITLDISNVADEQSTVYIRWGMGETDDSETFCGWNIDDIIFKGDMVNHLRITPATGFSYSGYEGGPFTSTNKTYLLSNTSKSNIYWSANSVASWLNIFPKSGSLNPGSVTNVTAILNNQIYSLPPGNYSDVIIFSNENLSASHNITVNLSVQAVPGEIDVTDSIAPIADLDMPFGEIITGLAREEQIIITNSDIVNSLIISNIYFGGDYFEDFNGGTAKDWVEDVDENWEVVSGEYRAKTSGTDFMIAKYGAIIWGDLSAEMKCRRTGTGGDGSSAALVLRATSDFDAGVAGSAYIFQIALNGSFAVWKQIDGFVTMLKNWEISAEINLGTNVLLAEAEENNLRFYVNGALLWEGMDSDLTDGHIGLGGFSNAGNTTHFFDDVRVGAPGSGGSLINAEEISLSSQPFNFKNLPNDFPVTISPGASLLLDIIYTPHLSGSNESSVIIESTDTNELVTEVKLAGIGINDYLEVTPETDYYSSGHPGGPFSVTNKIYQIKNSSPNSINWTAFSAVDWLEIVPENGTLVAGEAAFVNVNLTTAADTLGENIYNGIIIFSNITTTISHARVAELTVFTTPEIKVSPPEFTVTNVITQTSTETLVISNSATADGNLNFSLFTRETDRKLSAPEINRTDRLKIATSALANPSPNHKFSGFKNNVDYVPGELLVRFAKPTNKRRKISAITALSSASIKKEFKIIPNLALVKIDDNDSLEQVLIDLNNNKDVLYAEPNYIYKKYETIPNDSKFNYLWGMRNIGQTAGTADADIDASDAWDISIGSREIIVAVIDSGVDYYHEDLSSNMWRNPGEIPGNSIDDDNNGFVDDVYGYDFANNDGDPADDNDHGTHCAGTIGGVGNNGVGVAGVCWKVKIMACKFLDAAGSGKSADAVACIEYATMMGAHVMNNSWGGSGASQAVKDAIDAAAAADILFVAAAGNTGDDNDVTPHYPSSYESSNIIAVLATDHNDDIASFSCYGADSVDIGAPGVNILSCKRGGGYISFNGTSMAAPHVAGAAALMRSVASGLSAINIKNALMKTVDLPTTITNLCVSHGRMNIAEALTETDASWITLNPEISYNIPPGEAVDVDVDFIAGSLAPGVYNGEIKIVCNDLITPEIIVPAEMVVLKDSLDVNPKNNLVFEGYKGGSFSPIITEFILTNKSNSTLNWSTIKTVPWIDISPENGAIPPNEAIQISAFINSNANSLNPGNYAGIIIFSNEISAVSYSRSLTLNVMDIPGEIDITDSITPINDLNLPFGKILVGTERKEQITVTNLNSANNLIISNIHLSALRKTDSAKSTNSEFGFSDGYSILVYADDPKHPAPDTYLDQALDYLGLSYTAHYNADFQAFQSNLSSGSWDLVVFANDNSGPPDSTLNTLNSYLTNGGKLIAYSWKVKDEHELWGNMGVTYIKDDSSPPDPVYWWDSSHKLFNSPESVPQFTNLTTFSFVFGQYTQPNEKGIAIAGYSINPEPDKSAIIIANQEKSIFRSFLDVQNNADIDNDGKKDAVELWVNLISYELDAVNFKLENIPTNFPCLIAPGNALTFDVIFAPDSIGSDNAAVIVQSTDTNETITIISLSGVGINNITNAGNGYIKLQNGLLADQSIDSNTWTVYVEIGDSISGGVDCITENFMTHSNNAPFGYTWTWGARTSDFVEIQNGIPTGKTFWSTEINLIAPDSAGTNFILFGFNNEPDLHRVMACDNWYANGDVIWNDGNDYFDIDGAKLDFANNYGFINNWKYRFTNGYTDVDIPVMPIKVIVDVPEPSFYLLFIIYQLLSMRKFKS